MRKSKFLQIALKAAKEAERVIMKYYKADIEAEWKRDFSPVTIADIEAEKTIIETIKKVFPEHAFLSEESGVDTFQSECLWIIDPLDGTKRYIREIPLFGTQIALMRNGELVLGVSNMPFLKELLYAEEGKGAYCNDSRIRVSETKDLNKAYVSFGSLISFEKCSLIPNLLALEKSILFSRGIGDIWSYHLLARGKLDIVVETKVKIWDIAALKVIIEEAGGKVTDFHGDSVTKNTTSVIATNGTLHDSVVKIFK